MCNENDLKISRRVLFRGAVAGVGMLTLGPVVRLLAQQANGHRFVSCYMSGGWDVLLGADPRDPARTYSGIDLGTDRLPEQFRDPLPVSIGGREVLLGASMQSLVEHADITTIFRGINMNTVSHQTAASYSHTGIQPSTSLAKGNSVGTIVAASNDDGRLIPNVAISVPSYNRSFDNRMTAFEMSNPNELNQLIGPNQNRLPDEVEALLAGALGSSRSCVSPAYQGRLPSDQLELNRDRLKRLQEQNLVDRFNFNGGDEEMSHIRSLYDTGRTEGRNAATAAQMLRTGLSTSVSVRLGGGFDTHGNEWANNQTNNLLRAFDAIGALVTHLREDDPNFDRTTVVAYSEFARTPNINSGGGRDHWFNDSVVILGSSLKSGVFGASDEESLGITNVNASTGMPDESGIQLKPEHVFGTLVKSLGGDPFSFREPTLDDWIAQEEQS